MKYLSYIIIVVVMGIIGWTTENSLHSIFPEKYAEKQVIEEQLAKATEKETLNGMVKNFLE